MEYWTLLRLIADHCQIIDLKLQALATQALKHSSAYIHFSLTVNLQPLKIKHGEYVSLQLLQSWKNILTSGLFNKGRVILEKKCFFLKHIFLPCTNSNILRHICTDLEVTDGCHCIYKLLLFYICAVLQLKNVLFAEVCSGIYLSHIII